MNLRTPWIAALLLAVTTPFARADERFVVVPFSSLQFDDPAPSAGDEEAAQRFFFPSVVVEPYVVLDTPADVYLDFASDSQWYEWQMTPSRVAMRVDSAAKLSGRLFSATSSAPGFTARRFHIDSAPDDASARFAFYSAMEAHYRRLRDAGLPGAAWFRHQISVAPGKPASRKRR